MPYANLMVAHGATSYIAAPFFVTLATTQDDPVFGPYFWQIIAALGAVIVWLGGYIGARLSKTICTPTALTFVFALAFALAGSYFAAVYLAPHVAEARLWGEAFMLVPVGAAIAGYMLHRGVAQC